MIEATPMKASIALEHGYKIGNHNADDLGYEISYPDGYKSWCPAEEFDKYYYHIQDENGDMLYRNDIVAIENDIDEFDEKSVHIVAK